MKVTDFDRVVCITVDSRFPEWPLRARRQLEARGAECSLFLNGSARLAELGAHRYAQINGEVPAGFSGSPGAYHLAAAFLEVVRQADRDGVGTLLIVEDDLAFTPDYDRVTSSVRVPGDWGLFYFGANHAGHDTDEAGPNLLRLHGSYTTHCVGIHRRAFGPILALPVDRPIDVLLGSIHDAMPCYAAWPSVAVQVPGASTISGGEHADYRTWFKSKGRNWPAPAASTPTPGVARDVRLSLLRNACPHGTRASCGCSDLRACSKLGRDATRIECFACLESGSPPLFGPNGPPHPAG